MNKSIGPNLKYIAKIEEQQQLIEFLKQKYKETTGYESPLPSSVSTINATGTKSMVKSIVIPQSRSLIIGKLEQDTEEEKTNPEVNFYDAVANLKLPFKLPPDPAASGKSFGASKKPQKKTSFDFKN
jgi:hypothetical protein